MPPPLVHTMSSFGLLPSGWSFIQREWKSDSTVAAGSSFTRHPPTGDTVTPIGFGRPARAAAYSGPSPGRHSL